MLIGILANFCDCLTDVKYNFNPAIGREKELEELMITILTPGKSALLIGKPGVGKTAILEGLAYNIQKDNVPKVLKDFVIYKTSAATLNNNCVYNGMLEKNVLDLFNALEYRKEGLVTGIGANMFKLAGSVIIFGVVSSYIFGLLRLFIMGG